MLKSDHTRVIVHIDIDCFYAQVEEILKPELRDKNVGIQQKSCIVTCNYNARKHGVTKLMSLSDALKNCPDLVLVNGEDLTNYKQMSERIFEILSRFTGQIEKLGMDENFLDITKLIENQRHLEIESETFVIAGSDDTTECDCGCLDRLKAGTILAKEMRQALFEELNITTCAGIAYNKQLAKLVGSQNKPNKQTVIFDSGVVDFMRNLKDVRSLCGVGSKMAETLESLQIKTVSDLQNYDLNCLKKKLDPKLAEKLKSWSLGTDNSEIKPTGKPKSLSIEDSTFGNPLKNVYEIETKFSTLVAKLLTVLAEDGRSPTTFKVTVRKTVVFKDLLQRESKQAPIVKSMMTGVTTEVTLNLVKLAMSLFKKITNTESPFSITLLGVSFTKFEENSHAQGAIEKFLTKDFREVPRMIARPIKIDKSPATVKKSRILEWIAKAGPSDEEIHSPPTKKTKIDEDSTESSLKIPSNVDKEIFDSLPDDVKQDLILQWTTSNSSSSSTSQSKSTKTKSKSTLDRFFKPI